MKETENPANSPLVPYVSAARGVRDKRYKEGQEGTTENEAYRYASKRTQQRFRWFCLPPGNRPIRLVPRAVTRKARWRTDTLKSCHFCTAHFLVWRSPQRRPYS